MVIGDLAESVTDYGLKVAEPRKAVREEVGDRGSAILLPTPSPSSPSIFNPLSSLFLSRVTTAEKGYC